MSSKEYQLSKNEKDVISVLTSRYVGYIKIFSKVEMSVSDFDKTIRSLLDAGLIENRFSKSHATYGDLEFYRIKK